MGFHFGRASAITPRVPSCRRSFRQVLGIIAIAAVSMAAAGSANAALITSVGPIASLRIEGTNAFIGLTNSMAGSSTCYARVWVDLTTAVGRAVYATALSAFNTKQSVQIRAYEESQRVYGECNLYDIYVPQ